VLPSFWYSNISLIMLSAYINKHTTEFKDMSTLIRVTFSFVCIISGSVVISSYFTEDKHVSVWQFIRQQVANHVTILLCPCLWHMTLLYFESVAAGKMGSARRHNITLYSTNYSRSSTMCCGASFQEVQIPIRLQIHFIPHFRMHNCVE